MIPSLDDLVAVVRRVGDEVVLPRFTKVAHTRKADGSVLTEVDLQAQEVLRQELSELAPCALLGEEMTVEEQVRQWNVGRPGLWCVDPVDGTSNFVSGIPHFAVSIADPPPIPTTASASDAAARRATSSRAFCSIIPASTTSSG